MRGSTGISGGVFSRQGQLFAGGPVEGWLQGISPAVRLAVLVAGTAAAAFVSSPLVLAAIGSAALVVAVISYLDLTSILKLSVVPVLALALPSWLAGVLLLDVPVSAMGLGMLRVWCSVLVAMVMLHSIGLVHVAAALRGLGVPAEICTAWRMMIAQADSFSGFSAEMELARRARLIERKPGGVVRRLMGGQMGILLARIWQRSRELGMAMDAREIGRAGNPVGVESVAGSGVPGGQPLFQVDHVTHEFARGEVALDAVSAEIGAGGCVAILGCNGAGKSTLLHLLAGLLTSTQGEVRWRGEDVSAEALRRDGELRVRFRRVVGIAFQDPDCQWLCDSVQDEVEFGPMQIWSADEARERAAQAMVTMGVNHLGDRAPFTLSGGQKRRVALASVIAMDPDVLMLDEPTLSLDAATTDFLLDWLQEFLASGEKTLLLTTHDLGLVRELAERAIVLTPCHKLARAGAVDEILQDVEFLQQMNLAGRRARSVLH